jgi:hypothetical protein
MGLTVHFHIGLPATTPRDDVIDRVSRLRTAAELLPFAAVGPLVSTPEDPSLGPESPLEGLVRWWTWLQTDHAGPATAGSGLPDAIAFGIDVGDQCEPATFGVAWLRPRDEDFRTLSNEPASWRWLCSCKTQYASNVSEEHFLQCHMAIIALLDEAVRLGFEVEVGDEGNYWDTRDVEQLRRHVEDTSHIIARFAGALHDAVGEKHKVEAPIFERKDFERLEMDQ